MNNKKIKNYDFIEDYIKGKSQNTIIDGILLVAADDKKNKNSNVPKLIRMGKRASKLSEEMFSSDLKHDLSFKDRTSLRNLCIIASNTCYLNSLIETNRLPFITGYIEGMDDKYIASKLYETFKKPYFDNKQNKDLKPYELYDLLVKKIDIIRSDDINPIINRLSEGYRYNNEIKYLTKNEEEHLRTIVNYCAKVTKLEYSMVLYANGFIKYYKQGNIRKCEIALLDFYYQNYTLKQLHMDSTRTHLMNIIKDLKEYNLIDEKSLNDLKNIVNTSYKMTQDSLTNTDEYKNIIRNLINSDSYSLKEFAISNNIDISRVYNAIEYVKYADKKLYDEYRNKINLDRQKRYAAITNNIQNMVKDINDGILMENGNVREFGMLDYFNYTKMNADELKTFIKSNKVLNKDDSNTLIRFLNKNAYNFKDARKVIRAEKLSIDGHVVTDEERESVIRYLDSKHIPCSIKIYSEALRRYLNNELTKEKSKTK